MQKGVFWYHLSAYWVQAKVELSKSQEQKKYCYLEYYLPYLFQTSLKRGGEGEEGNQNKNRIWLSLNVLNCRFQDIFKNTKRKHFFFFFFWENRTKEHFSLAEDKQLLTQHEKMPLINAESKKSTPFMLKVTFSISSRYTFQLDYKCRANGLHS